MRQTVIKLRAMTYRSVYIFLVGLAAFFWSVTPVIANTEEENGDLLSAALVAVEADDWVLAEHYASQISDPVGLALIEWARLRAGEGEWSEYRAFLDTYADWPGLKRLRKQGEDVIPENAEPSYVRSFFATETPQTGRGAIRLAEALRAQGRTSEARDEVIRAWRNLPLTREEQSLFLRDYNGVVARHHQTRLENMLWAGRTRDASRMLELVDFPSQRVAAARIALQRGSKQVDKLIEPLDTSAQTGDAGLAYDRFRWRVKKDRYDDAEALLIERSLSAASLGRPEKWAERRRMIARRAMRAGSVEKAYEIASRHFLTQGSNYADLEWVSGYLALRYLDEPDRALEHFQKFKAAVESPISLGRAGYWLGKTHEALGDFDAAADAYEEGAKYQTGFYGQLSAEKIGLGPDHSLAGKEETADWRDGFFADSSVTRAAILLHYADEQNRVRWFLTHMAETMSGPEASQLADLALEMERPFVALGIAKEVAKRGVILARPYFPVTDLATYSADVDAEVAMAIARRESELNEGAVSPAGARGLMQLMPATARDVADDLGLEFSKSRLTSDWRYNATLGTAYLGGLLDIYRGSYVLSFAAYNAGPHRADRWIEQYGDPRSAAVDPVDWIEHIPFRETRNYVMRVIESLHVYRARMRGAAETVSLSADLNRG